METTALLYSKKEAAGMLSIGLRTLDSLVQHGQIRVLRVGKRVLIPLQSLQEFIQRQGDLSGK
jgi:excisionase family DNA binding protein